MSVRALVLVPTYNNARTIERVVALCLQHHAHVLVVNDGSTDGTGQLAERVEHEGRRATVLHLPQNRGKGEALCAGFEWGLQHGYSHAVTLDGDMQHRPEEIESFLQLARANPAALIVGVRDMSDAPGRSRLARWNSNNWIWLITGNQVGDSQTGYRVYPLEATLALDLTGSRYDLEFEVLARAQWSGVPVLQQPCDVWYAPPGESQSHFRLGADLALMTLMFSRLVIERFLGRAVAQLWARPSAR